MHQDRACSALRQPELQILPPRYFKGFHRGQKEVRQDRSREVKQEPSIAPPAPGTPSAEEVDLPAYIPFGMVRNVILLGTSSMIMQPQPSSTTKNGRRREHEALPVDTSAITEGAPDDTSVLIEGIRLRPWFGNTLAPMVRKFICHRVSSLQLGEINSTAQRVPK